MLVTRILGNCPSCGGINKFGNVSVRGDHILRGCFSCKYRETVPLPQVRKKILYLDQFFFSSAFHARDRRFVRAAERIRHVSALQLLAVPFSSIHEDETNQWRGYSGQNKDDLMKFIKATSRGHEFEPAYEVEKAQIERAFQAYLAGTPPAFQLCEDDAVEEEIHAWDDYIWIDVGRYIGDIELMRNLKQESVEALVKVFNQWRQSTHTFNEHVALEMREMAKGYIDSYCEYAARIISGDFTAVFNSPLMSMVVQSLLSCLPQVRIEERLKQVGQFFNSEHFTELPYPWLTTRIYATLAEMVRRGAYSSVDAPQRLSGFFQDIKHVATYAPYCHAFLMDKAMASLVRDPRIDLENRYQVRIFSLNNWDQFLAWLNELEVGMSQQHRAALSAAYP